MKYIAKFFPDFDTKAFYSLCRDYKVDTTYLPNLNLYIISSESEKHLDILYKTFRPQISIWEKDVVAGEAIASTPNDLYFSTQQTYLNMIRMPDAWDIYKGDNAVLAIVDNGYDITHPDLAGNLLPGWNTYLSNTDLTPSDNHGTQVASVAVAVTNNEIGMSGVGWNTKGVPIKTHEGSVPSSSELIKALEYCISNNIFVVNYSYSGAGGAFGIAGDALNTYARAGGIVVSAFLNNYQQYDFMPTFDNVLYCTGINNSYTVVSGYGPALDVVVPTSSIRVATGTSSYQLFTGGNSFGAPQLAAVCAMIKGLRPELGAADICEIIRTTANNTVFESSGNPGIEEYNIIRGHGVLDAFAAFQLAQTWEPVGWRYPGIVLKSPIREATFDNLEEPSLEVLVSDDIAVNSLSVTLNGASVYSATAPVLESNIFSISDSSETLNLVATVTDSADLTTVKEYSFKRLQEPTLISSQLEYIETDLIPGVEYELSVSGVNGGGEGPTSAWVPFTVPLIAPTTPPELEYFYDSVIAITPSPWATSHEFRINGGVWQLMPTNPYTLVEGGDGDVIEVRGLNSEGFTEPSEPMTLFIESAGTDPVITFIASPLTIGQAGVAITGTNFGTPV